MAEDVKHGTAEGFLSGCKCDECRRAEPDANVQAAVKQGATVHQALKLESED